MLTRPTDRGGSGIGLVEQFNDASSAQLCLGLLIQQSDLWVRVLPGEYGGQTDEPLRLEVSPHDSWLWKVLANGDVSGSAQFEKQFQTESN